MTDNHTVVLVDFDRKRLDRHTQALADAAARSRASSSPRR
jgi:hypothetical protein